MLIGLIVNLYIHLVGPTNDVLIHKPHSKALFKAETQLRTSKRKWKLFILLEKLLKKHHFTTEWDTTNKDN